MSRRRQRLQHNSLPVLANPGSQRRRKIGPLEVFQNHSYRICDRLNLSPAALLKQLTAAGVAAARCRRAVVARPTKANCSTTCANSTAPQTTALANASR